MTRMTMPRTLTFTAMLAASFGAAQVAAQMPPPDPFGDATVSRADAQAKAAAEFDTLDADHDGSLSPDELAAMRAGGGHGAGGHGGHHGGMMGRMLDANGDGKITKDEFVAGMMQRFDMADANHDGMLTKAERDAMREMMRQRWQQMRQGDGAMGGDDAPPPSGDDGQ